MEYIEIAKFKLKDGFTDEQFIEAEKILRAGEINQFKGYLGRELTKCDDGEWAIILRFDSKENMYNLLSSLKEIRPESFKPYASMIEFSTIRMEFFTQQI